MPKAAFSLKNMCFLWSLSD